VRVLIIIIIGNRTISPRNIIYTDTKTPPTCVCQDMARSSDSKMFFYTSFLFFVELLTAGISGDFYYIA